MPDFGGMSPKPGYSGGTDWRGGIVGNDIDVASANAAMADYSPRTQTQKAAIMVPAGSLAVDVTKDYGEYAGDTGRTGTIGPRDPYPTAAPPPPEG